MRTRAILVANGDSHRVIIKKVMAMPIPFLRRLELLQFLGEPGQVLEVPSATIA